MEQPAGFHEDGCRRNLWWIRLQRLLERRSAQNCHVATFRKWKTEGHEHFIHTNGCLGDTGKKRCTNGKANFVNAGGVMRKAFPKECVYAPPTSVKPPSSAIDESPRVHAAMSISYLPSSATTSAVRRAGLSESSLSSRVRTFQLTNRRVLRVRVCDLRPQ